MENRTYIERLYCIQCEKITSMSDSPQEALNINGLADSNRLFFVAEGEADICKTRSGSKSKKDIEVTKLVKNQMLLLENSSAFPISCSPDCEVYFFAFFGNLSETLGELSLNENTIYRVSNDDIRKSFSQYIENDHMGIPIGQSLLFTSFILELLTKISQSLYNVFLSESEVGINGFSMKNAAMREEGVFHGRRAVKITPNYSENQYIVLENYSLPSYNIDLKKYRWLQIQYYYESRDTKNAEAWLRILNFYDETDEDYTDLYNTDSLGCSFFTPIKRNRWCSAMFKLDYSSTVQKMINASPNPILRQIKIAPFGMRYNTELPKDDIMYISSVSFYTKNPEYSPLKESDGKCDINSVLVLMDATFNKNYALSYYADFCHFNLTYFLKWFKAHTGLTPHKYIINKQIEYAKVLLAVKHFKIEAISADAGFADSHYFARIFKKTVGITPSEYRKMVFESMNKN